MPIILPYILINMHKEILSEEQTKLFPLLKKFSQDFGLVGGTAIALHVGHRRSIDFDLFSYHAFRSVLLLKKVEKIVRVNRVLVNRTGELTFFAKDVKVTFFNYPFQIEYGEKLDKIIKIPDLLTLAAMKIYALGRRAKWKDYVDLYFIMKGFFSLEEIILKGKEIFGNEFNDKIVKTQLAYFNDINYDEEVEFLPGFEVSDAKIKRELIKFAIE